MVPSLTGTVPAGVREAFLVRGGAFAAFLGMISGWGFLSDSFGGTAASSLSGAGGSDAMGSCREGSGSEGSSGSSGSSSSAAMSEDVPASGGSESVAAGASMAFDTTAPELWAPSGFLSFAPSAAPPCSRSAPSREAPASRLMMLTMKTWP